MRQPQHEQRTSALVVKIGGSLLALLPDLVPVLRASSRPLLIIPGGGIFADAVRQTDADDSAAHWMAIAAMEQYGWLLSSQGIATTDRLAVPARTTILLPYAALRKNDPLPHSWNTTSDTIAAWVAGTLQLDLLLLKSVDGITFGSILQEHVSEPIKTDAVDPFFIPFILKNKIPATIINGSDPGRVRDFLNGLPVPGTTIGTTF